MIDKLFKDKRGNIVIIQAPNWPLYGWFIARILIKYNVVDNFNNTLEHLSVGFLSIWALMEILKGVNYFRRGLGLLILAFTILNMIK